ncbi:unnamed protein product, partial [Prorocentrum cordatum]
APLPFARTLVRRSGSHPKSVFVREIFLDGSAFRSTAKVLARAGWAAVTTTAAGELQAAVEALRGGVGPLTLYTDSAMVHDGWAFGKRWCLEWGRPCRGLWLQFGHLGEDYTVTPWCKFAWLDIVESVSDWLGEAMQEGDSLLRAPDGFEAPGLEAIRWAWAGCRQRPVAACGVGGPDCAFRACDRHGTALLLGETVCWSCGVCAAACALVQGGRTAARSRGSGDGAGAAGAAVLALAAAALAARPRGEAEGGGGGGE